jgi:hypothetical protein
MRLISQRYEKAIGKAMFCALGGLMFFFAPGCENSSAPRQGGMFPLSPGTSWNFSPGGGDSILGLVKINGQCYSEFVRSPVGLGPPYLRENEKQQVLFWNGAEEQILFDFEAAVRDSWGIDLLYQDFSLHYTVTLVSKRTTVTLPAGTFENCYRFDFTSIDVIDGNWIVVVAPNTGVVFRKGGFGFTIELESYSISDRSACSP